MWYEERQMRLASLAGAALGLALGSTDAFSQECDPIAWGPRYCEYAKGIHVGDSQEVTEQRLHGLGVEWFQFENWHYTQPDRSQTLIVHFRNGSLSYLTQEGDSKSPLDTRLREMAAGAAKAQVTQILGKPTYLTTTDVTESYPRDRYNFRDGQLISVEHDGRLPIP